MTPHLITSSLEVNKMMLSDDDKYGILIKVLRQEHVMLLGNCLLNFIIECLRYACTAARCVLLTTCENVCFKKKQFSSQVIVNAIEQ